MKMKNIVLGVVAFGVCNFALANGKVIADTFAPSNKTEWWHNLYIGIEGGMSLQNGLDITPDYSEGYWKTIPNPDGNYFEDTKSTAYVFGAKIGYFFTQQFSVDLAYDYHGNYDYNYSFDPSGYSFYSESADAVSIKDLNSQTIMLNFNFFPKLDWGNFKPFISVGAGIAFNDFGTYNDQSIVPWAPSPWNYDILGETTTSFAWQVGVGANYFFNDNVFMTAGYRFIDLGEFRSSDTLVDNLANVNDTISPWFSNDVYVNEFYLSLNYKF